MILSPVLALPGASPRSRRRNQFGKAQVQGQRGRQDQPGIVDQAAVVEGDVDAIGVLRGSIY